MLVQPGEGCLGEALHAGCGHHAVERLEEGPDDDTELVGSEELRTSFAVTLVSLLPGVGITLLWQQDRLSCLHMEQNCWSSRTGHGTDLLGAFPAQHHTWC